MLLWGALFIFWTQYYKRLSLQITLLLYTYYTIIFLIFIFSITLDTSLKHDFWLHQRLHLPTKIVANATDSWRMMTHEFDVWQLAFSWCRMIWRRLIDFLISPHTSGNKWLCIIQNWSVYIPLKTIVATFLTKQVTIGLKVRCCSLFVLCYDVMVVFWSIAIVYEFVYTKKQEQHKFCEIMWDPTRTKFTLTKWSCKILYILVELMVPSHDILIIFCAVSIFSEATILDDLRRWLNLIDTLLS